MKVQCTDYSSMATMQYSKIMLIPIILKSRGVTIDGDGMTMDELYVDCSHPYVSVLIMLTPSADRMVGVAGLKLCDGDTWKSSVKVCAELFSTATRSEGVSPVRNSIQYRNCSFGYFTFDLIESNDTTEPDTDSCTCQSKGNLLLYNYHVKSFKRDNKFFCFNNFMKITRIFT